MSTLPRTQSSAPTDDLFAGGGEMGRRMREYDWASHPLGPPDRWPQSLRTIIRIVLTSRYAMWMFWGDGYWFFCNDTYLPTLGIKGEWALGASTKKVWAEVWSAIESRAAVVFGKREATWDEGLMLFLERSGYREETYHTFSYSPLPADDGSIGGMLCVVTEETERVIGQRRLAMLRELAAQLAQTKTEQDVFAAAQRCLTAHPEDAPFALAYELDPHADSARLVCAHGIDAGHAIAPASASGPTPWPVSELVARREPLVTDLAAYQSLLPTGAWDRPPSRAAVVPLMESGQSRPSGFLVVGLNPFRPFADTYKGFIQLLAGQISAGLNSARAFEAERRRAAALAEIDRAKTEFFSNVSHEFRTPLTLMLGPLEDELRIRPKGNERIETAYRNSLRLLKLVNSLLDFSRSEAGRLQATYTPVDLGTFTRELASSFESLIAKAGLAFRIDSPALPADTWID
ncbi:MAG TPA: histidine kinase dimerization/phospho-acceptor domain-containing protein, partial [Opitutaceae bacterium]